MFLNILVVRATCSHFCKQEGDNLEHIDVKYHLCAI